MWVLTRRWTDLTPACTCVYLRGASAALDLCRWLLPQMLTVAAMLSAESIFSGNRGPDIGQRDGGRQGQGTPSSSSRGREILKRLVAEKAGDHVLLLRVWEVWARSNYDKGMVRDLGLDSRGMRFARDVRRQLAQLVGEDGAGLERGAAGRPLEVGAGPGRGSQASARGAARGDTQEAVSTSAAYSDRVRELRQALCLGYANKIARRMPAHNGYRTMNVAGQLAQVCECVVTSELRAVSVLLAHVSLVVCSPRPPGVPELLHCRLIVPADPPELDQFAGGRGRALARVGCLP